MNSIGNEIERVQGTIRGKLSIGPIGFVDANIHRYRPFDLTDLSSRRILSPKSMDLMRSYDFRSSDLIMIPLLRLLPRRQFHSVPKPIKRSF